MAVEFGLTKLLVPLRSSNSVVLGEAGVDGDGLLVEMTYSISELKPGCWKCLLPHFGLKRETIYVQPSSTQNLRGPV